MGRPTDAVDRQGQPIFHPSSYGLGAISGPAQFALAEPKTVGAAIRSPQLQPKSVRMHPTNEKQSFDGLLVRCCVDNLAVAPRMRTPVAGFGRLVEPLPYTFRLLTPLVLSRRPWAPPSQLQTARSATAPHSEPGCKHPVVAPCDACVGFTQRPRVLVSVTRFKGQRA